MKLFKQILLSLTLLASIAPVLAQSTEDTIVNTSPKWGKFFKKHIPSIVIGGLVGGCMGSLTHYVETALAAQQLQSWNFLVWFAEFNIRHSIIDEMQKDLNEYNIPHGKNSMHTIAWITSWIGYLQSRRS